MGDIVLDANTGIHAKQLSKDASGVHPIGALELLCNAGSRLLLTEKVRGEQVAGSVREHHERWTPWGWLRSAVVTANEVKRFRNAVGNARPVPNQPDIALLVLVQRAGGVFYSHDGPAVGWAMREKLAVVDMVDLAAYVVHRGLATWSDIELGHRGIGNREGTPKPDDWGGTVQATSAARAGTPRLFALLDAMPLA